MIEKAEQDWIFTFGFSHVDEVHGALRNRFERIRGTYHSAREEMVRRWGQKWAGQYESGQFRDREELNR